MAAFPQGQHKRNLEKTKTSVGGGHSSSYGKTENLYEQEGSKRISGERAWVSCAPSEGYSAVRLFPSVTYQVRVCKFAAPRFGVRVVTYHTSICPKTFLSLNAVKLLLILMKQQCYVSPIGPL